MVFELLPSVHEIILIDPIYAYNKQSYIQKELSRAKTRVDLHETLTNDASEDTMKKRTKIHIDQKEVLDGILQWRDIDFSENKKVSFNTSLAQNIK